MSGKNRRLKGKELITLYYYFQGGRNYEEQVNDNHNTGS